MDEYFDRLKQVESVEEFCELSNQHFTHLYLPQSEWGKLKKLCRKKKKDFYFIFNVCRLAYESQKEEKPFDFKYMKRLKDGADCEFAPAMTLLAEIYANRKNSHTRKIRKLLSYACKRRYEPACLLYAEIALFHPKYRKKKDEESLVLGYLHYAIERGDKEKAYTLQARYAHEYEVNNPYRQEMTEYFKKNNLPLPSFGKDTSEENKEEQTVLMTGNVPDNNVPPTGQVNPGNPMMQANGLPPLPSFVMNNNSAFANDMGNPSAQTPPFEQEAVFQAEPETVSVDELIKQATLSMSGENPDYVTAVNYLSRASAVGSVQADCMLADCYRMGNGVEKDVSKAFLLYQKANQMGYMPAIYRLAFCYTYGEGCEKDPQKATECFEKVANYDAKACYQYGSLLMNGVDLPADREKGFAYVSHAVGMGYTEGYFDLGRYLLDNTASFFNPQKAAFYLDLAAQGGKKEAYFLLGELYINTLYQCVDYKKAYTYLQKACELGDSAAKKFMQEQGDNLLNLANAQPTA